nr:hypothetical protein [Prevotella sp.]
MDKLYIPGDLVIVKTEPNNHLPKGGVCEFVSYCNRNKVFVRVAKGIDTFFFEKEQITPIPLTSEILEKNGWKFTRGFYCSPNEEGIEVGLSSQTGYIWEAYIGRRLLRSNINNVSDLQHLLFGLGINHEMEV